MKYSKLLVVVGIILLVGSLVSIGVMYADTLEQKSADVTKQSEEKVKETFPGKPTTTLPKATDGMAAQGDVVRWLVAIAGGDDAQLGAMADLLKTINEEGNLDSYLNELRDQAEIMNADTGALGRGIVRALGEAGIRLNVDVDQVALAFGEQNVRPLPASAFDEVKPEEKTNRESLIRLVQEEQSIAFVVGGAQTDAVIARLRAEGIDPEAYRNLYFDQSTDPAYISGLEGLFGKMGRDIMRCTLAESPQAVRDRISAK